MARYRIDDRFVKAHAAEIEAGQPVIANVRDNETFDYKKVKILLSRSPIEGGEEIEVLDMQGCLVRDKLYGKVLEVVDEEELEGFNIPGQAL